MESTRLPGKALFEICSKTIIQIMVERMKSSKKLDRIIIATSTNKKDNLIEKFCNSFEKVYVVNFEKLKFFQNKKNILQKLDKNFKIPKNIEFFNPKNELYYLSPDVNLVSHAATLLYEHIYDELVREQLKKTSLIKPKCFFLFKKKQKNYKKKQTLKKKKQKIKFFLLQC